MPNILNIVVMDHKPMKEKARTQIKDLSLLFSSCREYFSLHSCFFAAFDRFFPFDIPAYTNVCSFTSRGRMVYGIDNGEMDSWGTRTIKALKAIQTEFVLFSLDDFVLCAPANALLLEKALDVLRGNRNVGCVILHDNVKYEINVDKDYDSLFGIMKRQARWRVTTQMCIWRKSYLRKILRKGESAWDFEWYGTRRSQFYDELILYPRPIMTTCVLYPRGGLYWTGKLHYPALAQKLEKEYRIFLPTALPMRRSQIEKPSVKSSFKKKHWGAFSVFFPFAHFRRERD